MNKKIMFDSPEAAYRKTLTGWASSDGRFFVDENLARYAGCTHKICECGNEMSKIWLKCDECRRKDENVKYNAREFREWKGEPVYSCYFDEYFFDEYALFDRCAESEVSPEIVQLCICEPMYAPEIYEDIWNDYLPEDMTLDDVAPELAEALEVLNKFIRDNRPLLSWIPGEYRTTIKAKTEGK